MFYLLAVSRTKSSDINFTQHPSSKQPTFAENRDIHKELPLGIMQRSIDHGETSPSVSQALYLWFREHHKRGRGVPRSLIQFLPERAEQIRSEQSIDIVTQKGEILTGPKPCIRSYRQPMTADWGKVSLSQARVPYLVVQYKVTIPETT